MRQPAVTAPSTWLTAVAIYARESKANEHQIQVRRQIDNGRAYAKQTWPGRPVRVYSDNNRSGSKENVRRQDYDRFLEDVRAGEIGDVWAQEQSRLTRLTASEHGWEESMVALRAAGIREIHTQMQGRLGIAEGQATASRLVNLLDHEESERHRIRSRIMHDALIRDGHPNGGRSYGYTRSRDKNNRPTLVIDQPAARVIRRIVTELLRGHSAVSVATMLDADGIPTPGGAAHWTADMILKTARRPMIAGLRSHNGVVTGKGTWKPIIAPERYEALQLALGPAKAGTKHSRRWLLTNGLARCAACGTPLSAIPSNRGGTRYSCSPRGNTFGDACQTVHIQPAEAVEAFVVDNMLDMLAVPEVANSLADDDDPERSLLLEERRDAEAHLQHLQIQYARGRLDDDEWELMRSEARARIAENRAALRALGGPADLELPPADQIRSSWTRMPHRARQELLGKVFREVRIYQANGRRPRDETERIRARVDLIPQKRFSAALDTLNEQAG